ncbi:MAG: DUF4870 domain-containing protein [Dehalococcoidia bacterium]
MAQEPHRPEDPPGQDPENGSSNRRPGAGATATGLEPNIAGLLCYVFTWITGIVFLVLEKDDEYIRFHAWQSIFFGVAWVVLWVFLTISIAILPGILGTLFGFFGWLIVGGGGLAIWLLLMFKAYQGEKWRLPVIGDIAAQTAERQT